MARRMAIDGQGFKRIVSSFSYVRADGVTSPDRIQVRMRSTSALPDGGRLTHLSQPKRPSSTTFAIPNKPNTDMATAVAASREPGGSFWTRLNSGRMILASRLSIG